MPEVDKKHHRYIRGRMLRNDTRKHSETIYDSNIFEW